MATTTPTPNTNYTLSNTYTGTSQLFSSSPSKDPTLTRSISPSPHNRVYFTPTSTPNYFRIHTRALGDNYSLDVTNDAGVESTKLHFAETGDFSGQFWRLHGWGDGTVKLSNMFTGEGAHLDVYADSQVPFLGRDDHSGQHWTVVKAN
ncbi:hypothetical protein EJ06DRAFT_555742 [Trichodelitschia bisporula]|uniref:Ricin B lectin domain-containing protein n=1 Tax=Trichodelitschia bisporula TaxID=703511 RepID=A0A6G1HYL5_9PEZI|nr:hypothetical protein EJ06DRAFT_555742 [Trichodelitschia bisporula]